MAEFQEIIREFHRLCETQRKTHKNTCDKCPIKIATMGTMFQCYRYVLEKPKVAESIIVAWAAEHPEPVYPTWGEWLESEGICFSRLTNYERIGGLSIPQVFDYQIDGETAFICGDKVNTPIPTDIAQRLGIKPKEGT